MQAISSVGDLAPKQRGFLARQETDPKDKEAVIGLAREFNQVFSTELSWQSVRRFLTNLQRKERRQRNGGVVSLPDPPCVKVKPGAV